MLSLAGAALVWGVWAGRSPPPVLFVGARLLTLEPTPSTADALLVVDGRIAALGTRAALLVDPRAEGARVVDLAGRTLMPGFVDAHSHFPAVDLARFGLDLAPPPDGSVADLPTLLARLAADPGTGWLLGFDYDESGLDEARHPTRRELDDVVPNRPVWLRHRSGHMGVGNSAALAALGIDERQASPPGGVISRDDDGRLDGLLQESAAPSLNRLLRNASWGARLDSVSHARDVYLHAGVTTVQNGHASAGLELLLALAQRVGLLPQSVVVWQADTDDGRFSSALRRTARAIASPERFTAAAVKLIADGSPQGRTAWLSEPYAKPGDHSSAYRGIATLPNGALAWRVLRHHRQGRRVAIHANGDAAIDAALDAIEAAQRSAPRSDARHLIVHAQTVRRDQLMRMAKLDVAASFFPAHVRYWGEWHRNVTLGAARAARISPLAEADALGVRYSLHTDAPVTPMQLFQVVRSASERRLPSGAVLGERYRVSRLRALRALTIDAAWQAGLDHDRGSLAVGKRADLLVLSHDPLQGIRTPRVEGVWIDGRRVMKHAASESDR